MSATSAESLPTTGVWSIDSVHSNATFSVRHHAVATFRNSFTNLKGAFDADAGKLSGEVSVADLTLVGLDRLKGHLQTPDFFNAEEFPTFSFESTSITQDGPNLTVEGDLTLRGVTKPVTATGTWHTTGFVNHADGSVTERFGVDLSASIDRRNFGIDFNNEVAPGVTNLGWDVQLDVALELVRPVDK